MPVNDTDFIPGLRRHLPDPFLWSDFDFISPFGNDAGADVLSLYKQWRLTHPPHNWKEFIQVVEKNLDLPPATDFDLFVPTAENELELRDWDQALIGAAFSILFTVGELPDELRDLAIKAIEREKTLDQLSPKLSLRFGTLESSLAKRQKLIDILRVFRFPA